MRKGATERLRELLDVPGLIHAPVSYDPLSARIAESLGFSMAYLGGYAFGASTCITEPLTTMTEMVQGAGRIARSINIPLVIDGDAGFGEPMHTMRAIREMIWAGVAGTHIEDQHFPKRAHYHRDYREHVVSLEEMLGKLRMALRARDEEDPDFVIIGRTDAMRTDGYEEGVRRANAFLEAGVDLVMLFPNDDEETERAAHDVEGPVVYVNSPGNRIGRPVLSAQRLEELGYKLVVDAASPILMALRAVRHAYEALKEGALPIDPAEAVALRKDLEDLVGLEEFYKIEEETVEKAKGETVEGAARS